MYGACCYTNPWLQVPIAILSTAWSVRAGAPIARWQTSVRPGMNKVRPKPQPSPTGKLTHPYKAAVEARSTEWTFSFRSRCGIAEATEQGAGQGTSAL